MPLSVIGVAAVHQLGTFSRTQPLKEWKRTSISPSSSCKSNTQIQGQTNYMYTEQTFTLTDSA